MPLMIWDYQWFGGFFTLSLDSQYIADLNASGGFDGMFSLSRSLVITAINLECLFMETGKY